MPNKNILKLMYRYSPMNFYTIKEQKTLIKSTNNTSLGYEFPKEFSTDEIDYVWRETRLHKRTLFFLPLLLFSFGVYKFSL